MIYEKFSIFFLCLSFVKTTKWIKLNNATFSSIYAEENPQQATETIPTLRKKQESRVFRIYGMEDVLYAYTHEMHTTILELIGKVQPQTPLSIETIEKFKYVDSNTLFEFVRLLSPYKNLQVVGDFLVNPYDDAFYAHLKKNDNFVKKISEMSGVKCVFSNNSEKATRKILKTLGLENVFEFVFYMDFAGDLVNYKPLNESYERVEAVLGINKGDVLWYYDIFNEPKKMPRIWKKGLCQVFLWSFLR